MFEVHGAYQNGALLQPATHPPPPPPAAAAACRQHPPLSPPLLPRQAVRAQLPEATDYRTRGSMLYAGMYNGGAACNDSWVVACSAQGPWTIRAAGDTALKIEGPSTGFAPYKSKLIDCPEAITFITSVGGSLEAGGAFPGGCWRCPEGLRRGCSACTCRPIVPNSPTMRLYQQKPLVVAVTDCRLTCP